MSNFVVFNELSLPLDDNLWQQQLKQYMDLLAELRNIGILQVRIEQPFKHYPLFTQSKSLEAFFGSLSRDWKTRLRSILTNQAATYRSPLIDDDEQPYHEQWTMSSEYSYRGQVNTGGLACAHIWQSAAISFDTHQDWRLAVIKLDKLAIDSEEVQTVAVAHLSDVSHCNIHRQLLDTLVAVPETVEQLLVFCDLLSQQYPYRLKFSSEAQQQLVLYGNDAQLLQRLYQILKAVKANPDEGIGKPERLKNNLSGYSSRRIDDEHRLVYRIVDVDEIEVTSCRGHYY